MTLTATDIDVDELLKEIFDETHLCQVRLYDTEDSEYCLIEADWQWFFARKCDHVPPSYFLCDEHHNEMSLLIATRGLRCKTCSIETTILEKRKL